MIHLNSEEIAIGESLVAAHKLSKQRTEKKHAQERDRM
jgi:hypothetical protein